MTPNEIINWLRDKLPYAPDHAWQRKMQEAITVLTQLQNELRDEMHRHDRLQDFEVAEAAELAKLKEAHRWIPVSERLPEQSEYVLCYWKNNVRTLKYWRTSGQFEYCGRPMAVTHWRPLPEPPKGE